MSTRWSKATPDGRFELSCRIKDEWGDSSIDERHWRLLDTREGREIAAWHHEDDGDVRDVSFSDDFRALVIVGPDGTKTLFPLPC